MNQQSEITETYENFQYVSIKSILELVLSNNEIFDYVQNEKSRTDGLITNFRDAEAFKKSSYFKKYPNAIRCQLYNDDIVVNNPLG